MKRRQRLMLSVFLLVFVLSSLWTQEPTGMWHVIESVEVEVQGKSNEVLLRQMIEPKPDTRFESNESLVGFLESRRTKLLNLRIFEEVTYSWTISGADDGKTRYRVRFFIDDAFTFIGVPYPRYDSNHGYIFELYARDKNLVGSFAHLNLTVNATQIEHSWEDYEWIGKLSLEDLPVGESRVDLDFAGEATQRASMVEHVYWTGGLDWKGIKVAQTLLDLHIAVEENTDTRENTSDRWLISGIGWSRIPLIGSSRLEVRPQFRFSQSTVGSPWNPESISLSTSMSPILISGTSWFISDTITLKLPRKYLRSTASLGLDAHELLFIPLRFWVSADTFFHFEEHEFRDNTYAVGTTFNRELSDGNAYEGILGLSLRDRYTTALDHVPMLATTHIWEFGEINWRGNLRHGAKGRISGHAEYAFFPDRSVEESLNILAQAFVRGFLNVNNRFGLASRMIGFYSHIPSFDWYHDMEFPTFLPDERMSPPERLRGITNKAYLDAVGAQAYQKLGAVFNLDATARVFQFGRKVEGFLNLFVDVGAFTSTRPEERKNLIAFEDLILFTGAGAELYFTFGKLPSYPFRISLGIDVNDLLAHLGGTAGFTDIGYELVIGSRLHY